MNLSIKTLNAIGIICTILATIMLILVIVVPILLKRKLSNDFIEKCNPSLENTNIWATFPGELESKLLHTFKFFDYQETDDKENPLKINYKANIIIEEKVNYTNFSKDDNNIYFNNNRNYKNVANQNQNEDISIKSINLGMFEALETMSLELDKVMEEELEKRTLPNLKKYQECEDYKKLTDGQKQQIDKVVDMLSTEA